MLLYKFRSLHPLEYVADILLNRRMYCSEYRNLNDPLEGVYIKVLEGYGLNYGRSFGQSTEAAQTVNDLDENLTHTRICSFSGTLGDLRLWSHYADGHRGIAIEVDFPEVGQEPIPKKVEYVNSMRRFVDYKPNANEILCTKTNHWNYEKEYRLIHDDEYFNIENLTTKAFLGTRINEIDLDLLKGLVPPEIELVPTLLDSKRMCVKSAKFSDGAT